MTAEEKAEHLEFMKSILQEAVDQVRTEERRSEIERRLASIENKLDSRLPEVHG